MKIEKFHTNHLRNDAHFQFHTEFRDLIVKTGAQTLKIKPLFDNYLVLYAREDEALKKISKSALTDKIHEADKARDETYAAIVDIIRGMSKHYELPVRDAARRIKVVLDTYGNVAQKPMNEQTSAVSNILQELNGEKLRGDVQITAMKGWVTELERRNIIFDELIKERYAETASRSNVVMKDARKELDDEFRKICGVLNSYILMGDVSGADAFVRTLNTIMNQYGAKFEKHGGGAALVSGANSETSDVGGGSHGGGANGGIAYNAVPYDPNKHYSEYAIGDTVVMPNGDIYRVKSLGHVNFPPDSDNGHYSWEKIS